MNGSQLYNRLHSDIEVIKTKIENFTKNSNTRHYENKENIAKIFDKLDGLQCKTIVERVTNQGIQIGRIVKALFIIFGAMLTTLITIVVKAVAK